MLRNKRSIKKITMLAMLISFALVLSALERMLPVDLIIPVPGIKIGLPNLISIFAVFYLDVFSGLAVVIIRCLLAALMFGGITAFFFSVTGGLLAFLIMWIIKKAVSSFVSPIGISIAGSAFHNIGQIVAAFFVMRSTAVFGYLPLLLISSIGTGFFTGFIFYITDQKLSKIDHISGWNSV